MTTAAFVGAIQRLNKASAIKELRIRLANVMGETAGTLTSQRMQNLSDVILDAAFQLRSLSLSPTERVIIEKTGLDSLFNVSTVGNVVAFVRNTSDIFSLSKNEHLHKLHIGLKTLDAIDATVSANLANKSIAELRERGVILDIAILDEDEVASVARVIGILELWESLYHEVQRVLAPDSQDMILIGADSGSVLFSFQGAAEVVVAIKECFASVIKATRYWGLDGFDRRAGSVLTAANTVAEIERLARDKSISADDADRLKKVILHKIGKLIDAGSVPYDEVRDTPEVVGLVLGKETRLLQPVEKDDDMIVDAEE